ncbi:MAG: hypothetical protein IJ097_01350 [Bacilli bacterium]|nr:hypothetical protein [Bacilli bacterium]
MNLSLFEKFGTIFKYIFSSFLSIEMFILTILLFFILVVNLKRKNVMVQMIAIGVYIGFIIGIFISYTTYVKTCIDSFTKVVMNYIYFPSTIVYFFMIIFITVIILITLFSKKMTMFKKVFNYFFFSVIYFLFMSFISLAAYDGVDLLNIPLLYENDTILSLVQISNFILLIWIIYTAFYYLYKYFKKKYDK